MAGDADVVGSCPTDVDFEGEGAVVTDVGMVVLLTAADDGATEVVVLLLTATAADVEAAGLLEFVEPEAFANGVPLNFFDRNARFGAPFLCSSRRLIHRAYNEFFWMPQ